MAHVVRPLRDGDVEPVVAFALRAWEPVFASLAAAIGPRLFASAHPDWRAEQAAAVRANCRRPCWVAVAGDRPVGWLALVHDADARMAAIEMLAVDPDHQGRGIAGELIDTAITEAAALRCDRVEVWTGGDEGHGPARRAYEKAGFTPFPVVHYYRSLSLGDTKWQGHAI